jgi:hypothetical protein
MPPLVAEKTGGDDVLRRVCATLGSREEMLCSASENLRMSDTPAFRRRTIIDGVIPHRQAAIVAAAFLREHLRPADVLKCSHSTGTPFDFVRSECAAS